MKYSILIILFFGCASQPFEGWDAADTTREIAYCSLVAVDYLQTKEILTNPEYEELNPMISESNIDLFFVGTTVLHVCISGMLNDEWRERWQTFSTGARFGIVVNNYSIGVRP